MVWVVRPPVNRTVRIVTFGDSNTDAGYRDATLVTHSYVSPVTPHLAASDPNDPTQLAGKLDAYGFHAVNHGIAGSNTANHRLSNGSPDPLLVVHGITRFQAECLGAQSPTWDGGEVPTPLVRSQAFAVTVDDWLYLSLGTNDSGAGIAGATSIANLQTMVDYWINAGLPASHLIMTTLAPVSSYASTVIPALNALLRTFIAANHLVLVDLANYTSPDNGATWRAPGFHVGDGTHYREFVRDWIAGQIATIVQPTLRTRTFTTVGPIPSSTAVNGVSFQYFTTEQDPPYADEVYPLLISEEMTSP